MNRRRNWSNQLSSVAAVIYRLKDFFWSLRNFINRRKKTSFLNFNSRNRVWILVFFPQAELALQLACAGFSVLIIEFSWSLNRREAINSNVLLFVIPQELNPWMFLNSSALILRKLINLKLKSEFEFFGLWLLGKLSKLFWLKGKWNSAVIDESNIENGKLHLLVYNGLQLAAAVGCLD